MNFYKTYKLLMEEFETPEYRLSTSDLYNFYYLFTLLTQGRIRGDYAEFVTKDFMSKIRNRYLVLFKGMLYEQIQKYIRRGRVDNGLTMEELNSKKDSAESLFEMMKRTYRSDMRRRNDVWNLIAEYVVGLENNTSASRTGYFIDRINNCVHNTGEIILSKFSNASELMRTFDEIHNAPSLNSYKNRVSKDIREIE